MPDQRKRPPQARKDNRFLLLGECVGGVDDAGSGGGVKVSRAVRNQKARVRRHAAWQSGHTPQNVTAASWTAYSFGN